MNAVKEEEKLMSNIKVHAYFGIKRVREDGLFDLNEDIIVGEDGSSGDGRGGVVVEQEVKEEEVVGVKRKAEEETKPKKTKKKRTGNGFTWTEEEDDALLKGVGKYGLDYELIKEKNGKVLADRTPDCLRQRLYTKYPEKYEELWAATPWKPHSNAWTSEEDDALKRGVEKHGKDWEKIKSKNELLRRRTLKALQQRYKRKLKYKKETKSYAKS
ncbi:hypothetical protein TrST_g3544 [Triparma strigata]|uniref:Myb-like domain-containing protein n=1 Tax=Triparma strigata TaxID=1606541 RepID=A0A9W7EGT4_9STRA|nr:hypothetical protein TrST_g3544 [Triparma strigata]